MCISIFTYQCIIKLCVSHIIPYERHLAPPSKLERNTISHSSVEMAICFSITLLHFTSLNVLNSEMQKLKKKICNITKNKNDDSQKPPYTRNKIESTVHRS